MAKQKTTITTPVKRPDAFGAAVKLKTAEDVNAALAELRWLAGRQAMVDASLEERHQAVEKEREKLEALTIDSLSTSLGERAAALDEAVKKWLPDHLEKLLPDDGKTLKLEHGQLTTKGVAAYIRPIGDLTEEQVIEKLEAASEPNNQIMAKVRGICAVFFNRAARVLFGDLVTIKVTANKTGRLAAWKEKRLTDEQLKQLGLEAVTDEKTFSYKLN